MHTPEQISEHTVDLLASLDLEKVAKKTAEIVQAVSGASAVALIMWDRDLEELSDRFIFGEQADALRSFVAQFCDQYTPANNEWGQLTEGQLTGGIPAQLQPLFCWQVREMEEHCAFVLISAPKNQSGREIIEHLAKYPIGMALLRVWEYRELQRENARLRSNYEELEDKTSLLEEQTRKLIHDLTARDSIRTRHVERERLVYLISNVVRSFVDIRKVLETTVERIGTTFGVNRCLLLRPIESDSTEQLSVYEFTRNVDSIKDFFSSEEGRLFTQAALKRTTPSDISTADFVGHHSPEANFLSKLGIKSGLLVPMVLRDTVLGVLFLQDCDQMRDWSIDDISLINSLADQVSVAIENAELHLEKERQATTDSLTGIANRRSFNEEYAREFERAWRYKQPLSLVLIDMDFLKMINDNFGHQVGDEAIKEIGRLLKQSSRAVDLAARYGGEEFCLLLPNTEVSMAEQLAERLHKVINEVHLEGPGHISASFGIASYPMHASDPDTLFRKADAALYQAKQAGRNMVKVASVDPSHSEDNKPMSEDTIAQENREKQQQSGNMLKAARLPEPERKSGSSAH